MKVSEPTYFIAELAGDVVPLVRNMRQRFNPKLVHCPADITIAGSSGVGTVKEGQDVEAVIERLTPIVSNLGFKKIAFVSVEHFPNTGIYYLAPEREAFDCMHDATIRSEVEFDDNEWPYNPHCTLRWEKDDNAECKELFASLPLPQKTSIECFSLYQPGVGGGRRVHRF